MLLLLLSLSLRCCSVVAVVVELLLLSLLLYVIYLKDAAPLQNTRDGLETHGCLQFKDVLAKQVSR